jgi:prepilin-type N-terminal cleavage/methylation domain-containing protein
MTGASRTASTTRPGITLIELLVVLAILGVTMAIAGLALRAQRRDPDPMAQVMGRIERLRHEAVIAGHDVSATVKLDERIYGVTAYPDGRVVTDSLPALDPLTGRPAAEGRSDAQH